MLNVNRVLFEFVKRMHENFFEKTQWVSPVHFLVTSIGFFIFCFAVIFQKFGLNLIGIFKKNIKVRFKLSFDNIISRSLFSMLSHETFVAMAHPNSVIVYL